MERPVFFPSHDGYNLFGVLHSPEKATPNLVNHALGVVFCHPFAEEKLIAHRVLVNLARRLSEEGIYCLRFDEMGHGDSEGNFEDSTVDTRLSDIRCAVKYLREHAPIQNVGLIGVRLGATLAALSCVRDSKADFLVMVSPVVQGRSYIEQCLRSNLTTQMIAYGKIIKDRKVLLSDLMAGGLVNIDGYLISKVLYQQVEQIDLLKEGVPASTRILLIQVSAKENQPLDKNIEALHAEYGGRHLEARVLKVVEDLFWKDTQMYKPEARSLENAIVSWLHEVLQ